MYSLSLCYFFVWSGKSLQLLLIFPFGMLCLHAIRMIFVKACWQCACWWVWCPVSFLVVGESQSLFCSQ